MRVWLTLTVLVILGGIGAWLGFRQSESSSLLSPNTNQCRHDVYNISGRFVAQPVDHELKAFAVNVEFADELHVTQLTSNPDHRLQKFAFKGDARPSKGPMDVILYATSRFSEWAFFLDRDPGRDEYIYRQIIPLLNVQAKKAKEYTLTEPDLLGTYQANYRWLGKEQLEKRKASYQTTPHYQSVGIKDSTSSYQFIPGTTDLLAATIHDQLHLRGQNMTYAETHIELTLKVTRISGEATPCAYSSAKEALAALHLRDFPISQPVEQATQPRDQVSLQTAMDMTKKLRGLDASVITPAEDVAKLVNKLNESEEFVDFLAKEGRANARNKPYFQRLLGMLASAETAYAQRAWHDVLEQLLQDSPSDEVLRYAVTSLSPSPAPLPENVDLLIEVYEDQSRSGPVRESALLAGSAATSSLADAEQKRLRAEKLHKIIAAEPKKLLAIEALGNLGGNEIVPILNSLVDSQDPFLVERGIHALRKSSSSQASEQVLHWANAQPESMDRSLKILEGKELSDTALKQLFQWYKTSKSVQQKLQIAVVLTHEAVTPYRDTVREFFAKNPLSQ